MISQSQSLNQEFQKHVFGHNVRIHSLQWSASMSSLNEAQLVLRTEPLIQGSMDPCFHVVIDVPEVETRQTRNPGDGCENVGKSQ